MQIDSPHLKNPGLKIPLILKPFRPPSSLVRFMGKDRLKMKNSESMDYKFPSWSWTISNNIFVKSQFYFSILIRDMG
jgi:hypothetical protein